MEAYDVKFKIWADSMDDVKALEDAMQRFVTENGKNGIAITAKKTADAVDGWKSNPIVKNQILNYYGSRK